MVGMPLVELLEWNHNIPVVPESTPEAESGGPI